MFLCAVLMGDVKKNLLEFGNCRLKTIMVLVLCKDAFKSVMFCVNILEAFYESREILPVEGTMHKVFKPFQIMLRMGHYKIVWRVAHQCHHLMTILDNHLAVSPSNGRAQETR